MSNFCDRLRDERERLGLTQEAFGAVGGVKKQAQLKYEKGERSPDGVYLESIAKIGVDVQYIVTGRRSAAAVDVDPEINELISLYRNAPLAVKAAAIRVLSPDGGESVPKGAPASKFNISGDVGHVTQGKVKGGITVQMGESGTPKKK